MLPYTPLQQLLLADLTIPIVETSGNVSDEPMRTDEQEAVRRLGDIADPFLVHNRPIARAVDASAVRLITNGELVLRRARGFAPLPIQIRSGLPCILAVGAQLKNSIATSVRQQIFVSQHIGDLGTEQAVESFRQVSRSFERLYGVKPTAVACYAHPDYQSTKYAHQHGVPVKGILHHFAHVVSCMAENDIESSVLGVAWDGTGYGLDGTIWGGEFLRVHDNSFSRVAHFCPFRLPGGERAIGEPRRSAIGLIYEMFADIPPARRQLPAVEAFRVRDVSILLKMLERKIKAPLTSSVGRLSDGVAAIVGVGQNSRFEGQAAMELEFALDGVETDECYRLPILTSRTEDVGAGLDGGGSQPGRGENGIR